MVEGWSDQAEGWYFVASYAQNHKNHPVLQFQAETQKLSSSFYIVILRIQALKSPSTSGIVRERLCLLGAARLACNLPEIPAVRDFLSLLSCSMFGGVVAEKPMLFALTCTMPRAHTFNSQMGLLLNLERKDFQTG